MAGLGVTAVLQSSTSLLTVSIAQSGLLATARVVANMQLALNVLVSSDLQSAWELISEKRAIRELERKCTDRHLARPSSGQIASISTFAIHLDAIKDLRQINSQLSSVAYPNLKDSGYLDPNEPLPAST